MKINDVRENDNGEWECSVTAKSETGDYEVIRDPIGRAKQALASSGELNRKFSCRTELDFVTKE